LGALSYADNAFDLVFTSETLEHVPDVPRALSEIYRVLRPGGCHLFTVPVVWERPATKIRAKFDNGGLVHLSPPSFHGDPTANASDYLVFSEFGSDIEHLLAAAGFEVWINRDPSNPAIATFVTYKPGHASSHVAG
jgi:ubiquinone/menaquinone biosynthesis C-methylase UbiE